MDHFGDDSSHRFHGMEQGFGQRDMNMHQNFNDGVHYQGFAPRFRGPQESGPRQRNMHMYQGYNNTQEAGGPQRFAPRMRVNLGGGPRRPFQSSKATENTGSAKGMAQFGKGADGNHKQQDSQAQRPQAGSDQTPTSRERDEEDLAEQGETQYGQDGQLPQRAESDQQKADAFAQHFYKNEQLGDGAGESWKPFQETAADTKVKKESDAANDDDDDEEEDEKAKAIKKLPAQHSRGLMSTLIGLVGPEAQNKKPDPLPPPRPMKLEDDVQKYLGPTKGTTKAPAVSEHAFLESGITAKMLAEANMEVDYSESDFMPDDIGRQIERQDFYCKLCQKQMTSLGNFRDHLNGKSHKSMLDAVRQGKTLPKGKKRALKSPYEIGQKSVCMEVVEGATESIIGLSFITEYHSVAGVVCVCNLCAVKFDQNIVVSHTTGCKHRLRYMREKKPSVYVHLKKFGGKKSQLTSFLSDLCVGVEKEDGRGFPSIKIYHPGRTMDDDDVNRDEFENMQLINQAKRNANVDDKDLEVVDFQDWVNREMRRSKELYEANKRSPSPGYGDGGRFGDGGRSMDSYRPGRQRSPSVMSDARGRDFPRPELSHLGPRPPMFPQVQQEQMYMPQPLPPPMFQAPVFSAVIQPQRFDPFVGQNFMQPMIPVPEPQLQPESRFDYAHGRHHNLEPDHEPKRHIQESGSSLSSNKEVSRKKSAAVFDYGHGDRDKERDDVRTSRQSPRNRDRDDARISRQSARSRDRDDVRISRQSARSRDMDDVLTSRQSVRSRADERDDMSLSRKLARSRADERDNVDTSRQIARSRADERGDVGTSRQIARSRADERDVSTSVSRADKWEVDIQHILGHGGKKSALDSLALLSRTYSSPERRRSPSPPKKIKQNRELPFSKTYLEMLESQKRQKDRRSSNEQNSDLSDNRRVKSERFDEARPKSRSPDVPRTRHRSPENYVGRSAIPQSGHLTRRIASQRIDTAEHRSRSPRRSRSPVNAQRQRRSSRSPRDASPVRSYKKQAAAAADIDTDAEAERIANLLLELSSTLSGQEDPQTALQTLFSNADLTRALLSSRGSMAGGTSSHAHEKLPNEKQHGTRSTEVGQPSGRHYPSVEKPSRYAESPDTSRRYASNYPRNPEPSVYQDKPHPSAHSFARPESSRAPGGILKPFSLSGFNRAYGVSPKTVPIVFVDDSDDS